MMITRLVAFGTAGPISTPAHDSAVTSPGEPASHVCDRLQGQPVEDAGRRDGGTDDEDRDDEHPARTGKARQGDSRSGDAEHHPGAGKHERQHALEQRVQQQERWQCREQHDQGVPGHG